MVLIHLRLVLARVLVAQYTTTRVWSWIRWNWHSINSNILNSHNHKGFIHDRIKIPVLKPPARDLAHLIALNTSTTTSAHYWSAISTILRFHNHNGKSNPHVHIHERIMHTRIKTKRQKLKPYKCNGFVGIYK